jgi:hypothetical protein
MLPERVCTLLKLNAGVSYAVDVTLNFYYWCFLSSWKKKRQFTLKMDSDIRKGFVGLD